MERIQREMEEREQEELKAYLAARGKKVGAWWRAGRAPLPPAPCSAPPHCHSH